MNMKDILLEKVPHFNVTFSVTNNELEKAIQWMIQKETGISLQIKLLAEWGNDQFITVNVPAWESDKIPKNEKDILEKAGYGFDEPSDEDLDFLVERLFRFGDKTADYIEANRSDMQNENDFTINILMDIEHYAKLKHSIVSPY